MIIQDPRIKVKRTGVWKRECEIHAIPNGLTGIPSCVLIGISYDLWTFGIPGAFSVGIRAGNAVGLQMEVKLMHYSG